VHDGRFFLPKEKKRPSILIEGLFFIIYMLALYIRFVFIVSIELMMY
jgi:hypothetical protein